MLYDTDLILDFLGVLQVQFGLNKQGSKNEQANLMEFIRNLFENFYSVDLS